MTRTNQAGNLQTYAGAALVGILFGLGAWYLHVHAPQTIAAVPAAPLAQPSLPGGSAQRPAALVATPAIAPLLAAARAGQRIVAVGEHGVVLLSDDQGKTWRQARSVPSQALLTSLCFVDGQQGWIAGHDGVVLHTTDGGDTWTVQHEALDGDKPLFSIWFKDAQHGFAVGLFGTAIQTADGGASWTPLSVETGEGNGLDSGGSDSGGSDSGDRHLYGIFGKSDGALYIAGEAGLLYRSADGGASWTTIKTSNPGSFWTGLQLADGSLLAAGQRGHLFASHDQGATWTELPSGTQESLTSIQQDENGGVLVTGLAGTLLNSSDGGKTFTAQSRADRVPLNAAITLPQGRALLFGDKGVITD